MLVSGMQEATAATVGIHVVYTRVTVARPVVVYIDVMTWEYPPPSAWGFRASRWDVPHLAIPSVSVRQLAPTSQQMLFADPQMLGQGSPGIIELPTSVVCILSYKEFARRNNGPAWTLADKDRNARPYLSSNILRLFVVGYSPEDERLECKWDILV